MRKTLMLCSVLFFGISVFASGLGTGDGDSGGKDSSEKRKNRSSVTNYQITPKEKIEKIRGGFSSVLYRGNYLFDEFLENGGAKKDRDILTFLRKTMLSKAPGAEGLDFEGSVFGCSTFSVPNAEGGYLFARNFDWMKSQSLVVVARPSNGYSSVSTVNLDFIKMQTTPFVPDSVLTIGALYAPLDGMNEKGLCVAVNMIEDSDTIEQNSEKPDLTTTTAVRLLLDKAADVDEAIRLLSDYDLHASFGFMVHFALSDAKGRSVVIEYIDNKMKVTETNIVTNFFLTPGRKKGIGSAQSHERYKILDEILNRTESMTEEEAAETLSRVSKKNFEKFLTTEWSIVYDRKNMMAHYYHRENFKESFSFSLRP